VRWRVRAGGSTGRAADPGRAGPDSPGARLDAELERIARSHPESILARRYRTQSPWYVFGLLLIVVPAVVALIVLITVAVGGNPSHLLTDMANLTVRWRISGPRREPPGP